MVRDVPTMIEWAVLRNIPRNELQIRAAAFNKVFAPPFTLFVSKDGRALQDLRLSDSDSGGGANAEGSSPRRIVDDDDSGDEEENNSDEKANQEIKPTLENSWQTDVLALGVIVPQGVEFHNRKHIWYVRV